MLKLLMENLVHDVQKGRSHGAIEYYTRDIRPILDRLDKLDEKTFKSHLAQLTEEECKSFRDTTALVLEFIKKGDIKDLNEEYQKKLKGYSAWILSEQSRIAEKSNIITADSKPITSPSKALSEAGPAVVPRQNNIVIGASQKNLENFRKLLKKENINDTVDIEKYNVDTLKKDIEKLNQETKEKVKEELLDFVVRPDLDVSSTSRYNVAELLSEAFPDINLGQEIATKKLDKLHVDNTTKSYQIVNNDMPRANLSEYDRFWQTITNSGDLTKS